MTGTNGNGKSNGNGEKSAPIVNGRNRDGTFPKGHPGGPGRKKGVKAEIMARAWNEHITPEVAAECLQKYIAAIRNGERWAIQDCLDRCLGKAAETHKVEGVFTFVEALAMLRPERRDEPIRS